MVLIGLAGTHGAGKGTVTAYLQREHGFEYVSVSEFLAEEAERRGLKSERPVREEIANEYRAKGSTGLMEATFASIDPKSSRVILEPQYTVAEVEFIQNNGGIVVAVDADLEIRYARITKRGSPKDQVAYEEFCKREQIQMQSDNPDRNNITAAMNVADIRLVNNGTLEEFEKVIQDSLTGRGVLK